MKLLSEKRHEKQVTFVLDHDTRDAGTFGIFRSLLVVCLVLALSGIARASDTQSGRTLRLDLHQLVTLALQHSDELAAAKSEVSVARSNLNQVKWAYYPQLDVTGVTGPTSDADLPVVENGKITNPSPSSWNVNIFGRLDFTITQPLYTFGKLDNNRQAAMHGVRAKKYMVEQKHNEVILRVKRLYYALVLANQGVAAANESNNFYNDAERRIKAMLKVHSPNVQQSDLYRIDAYRGATEKFKAEAEAGRKLTHYALKAMLGLSPGENFVISQTQLPSRGVKLGKLHTYVQQALVDRPELRSLQQGVEADKFRVDAARSEQYPSIFAAVEGSLAVAPGRQKLDNPYIEDNFNHSYAGIVLGLKWHFDFGITRARIQKARAEYIGLLDTQRYAEKNIPVQVVKAYEEVLQWEKAAQGLAKAARASRKWIIVAFSDFDMGVGTANNMFQALDKYGQNRGDYLNALYHYNLSLAQLEYAIGTSKPGS